MSKKYVYTFEEGDKDQKDLLGGKGANLGEMTSLGLPVPPGFTITTEACRYYMHNGKNPDELEAQVTTAIDGVEKIMGRKIGGDQDPLLVSVRSGAKFSMPGMMETVLNVGLNDKSVEALAKFASDNERFAWDSYRRLIQMFGNTVMDVDRELFADALDKKKEEKGVKTDPELSADALKELVVEYKKIYKDNTGEDFPQDPREQIDKCVIAVFNSWNTDRAKIYRQREKISDELGTAVNVQTMVFGNINDNSGTGVGFTRNAATGEAGVYGDYLVNAQGEDVVAGIRNTLSLDDMAKVQPQAHKQLIEIMKKLESHYKDMCDIEFTVENGNLWMLQTRIGKRTAEAAFKIASQLVDENVIDLDEALRRVTGEQLNNLMFPQFDKDAKKTVIAKGMAASPGAAVGEAVFDSKTAKVVASEGRKVILVRRETNPDDLEGMIAAEGVLTSRGGKTSHAAVVARGMGTTCVVGADKIDVSIGNREFYVGDVTVKEGDIIAIDGSTGEVFLGEVPVVPSEVVNYLQNGLDVALDDAKDEETKLLVKAVDRIMSHADKQRTLGVWANADVADDADNAKKLGAEGIGLCRTEHQFLGDRRVLIERLILASATGGEDEPLAKLLPLQIADFKELFTVMDGKPTVIRLIDPPLHEFLPDQTELAVQIARAEARGHKADEKLIQLLGAVERMHEANPMLGLRGVRLGIVIPGLFELQINAIVRAAAELIKQGKNPQPKIMVPLVVSRAEIRIIKERAVKIIADVEQEYGIKLNVPIGCMIELPRAAITADEVAEQAEFFSFGTNDLTQTTWGFSRDDVEGAFFTQYMADGIFTVSPFESLDQKGVGALVNLAVKKGRETRPDINLGVCGEHGGDPVSIHFFHKAGLHYVSCSPFRVPVARLEAGRAAVGIEE